MTATCYLDLSQITLAQIQQRLERQDLLPSRQILLDEIALSDLVQMLA